MKKYIKLGTALAFSALLNLTPTLITSVHAEEVKENNPIVEIVEKNEVYYANQSFFDDSSVPEEEPLEVKQSANVVSTAEANNIETSEPSRAPNADSKDTLVTSTEDAKDATEPTREEPATKAVTITSVTINVWDTRLGLEKKQTVELTPGRSKIFSALSSSIGVTRTSFNEGGFQYTFLGWFTEETGGTLIDTGTDTSSYSSDYFQNIGVQANLSGRLAFKANRPLVTDDEAVIDIYAHWSVVELPCVKTHIMDTRLGEAVPSSVLPIKKGSMVRTALYNLLEGLPESNTAYTIETDDGTYVFKGWFEDEEGTKPISTSGTTIGSAKYTMYAIGPNNMNPGHLKIDIVSTPTTVEDIYIYALWDFIPDTTPKVMINIVDTRTNENSSISPIKVKQDETISKYLYQLVDDMDPRVNADKIQQQDTIYAFDGYYIDNQQEITTNEITVNGVKINSSELNQLTFMNVNEVQPENNVINIYVRWTTHDVPRVHLMDVKPNGTLEAYNVNFSGQIFNINLTSIFNGSNRNGLYSGVGEGQTSESDSNHIYNFLGWYDQESGGNFVDENYQLSEEYQRYYSIFKINSADDPTAPYGFTWNSNGGGVYLNVGEMIPNDLYLYGRWETITAPILKYRQENNVTLDENESWENVNGTTSSFHAPLESLVEENGDHQFLYWKVYYDDESNREYDGIEYAVTNEENSSFNYIFQNDMEHSGTTEALVNRAWWQPSLTVILYDTKPARRTATQIGYKKDYADITIIGENGVLSEPPVREGYTFVGWFVVETDEEYTENVVSKPDPSYETPNQETGVNVPKTVRLYAKWTKEISVTKEWVDSSNENNLRPQSVTIDVYASNQEEAIKSFTLSGEGDSWSSETITVDGFDETGNEIVYTAVEDEMPYYNTTIDGLVVTNTLKPEGYVYVEFYSLETNEQFEDSRETLHGIIDTDYETEAKSFENYTLVPENTEGETTGKYQEEPITVKYYYSLNNGKVIVHYVDQKTNEEFAYSQEELTGKIGTVYETVEKDFTHYQLVETPSNATGEYAQEDTHVYYYYTWKQGTVNVHYYEKNGEELVEFTDLSDTLTGNVDSNYETTKLDIEHYHYVGDSGNVVGIYTEEDITVNYYYEKNQGNVIVHHVNKDTNEEFVEYQETTTQNVGEEYETNPVSIPNYTLDEETLPENATGEYTEEDTHVYYYYVINNGEVIVKYINTETGEEFEGTQEHLEGKINSSYETVEKTFENYTLDRVEGETTGFYQAEPITVTYYYSLNNGKVIVHYVDKDTNEEFAEMQEILIGKINSSYETIEKSIDLYTFDSSSDNTNGQYTAQEQDVYYYYVKNTGHVTVYYVDKDDPNIVLDTQKFSGKVESPFIIEEKEFDLYKWIDPKPQMERTIPEGEEDVFLYYVKRVGEVNVSYVDILSGDEIADAEHYSGSIDQEYQTIQKEIDGYRFVRSTGLLSGYFQDGINETVVYYYEAVGSVTIKYLEKNTDNVLADEIYKEGPIGAEYYSVAKTIDTYQLVETPNNANGTYTIEPIDAIYYYSKIGEVKVFYIDKDNHSLIDEEYLSINGVVGDSYITQEKVFNGYQLFAVTSDEENNASSGIITENTKKVTYIYEQIPEDDRIGIVTIIYKDEETDKEISPRNYLEGIVGDNYRTTFKDISNYQYSRVEGSEIGTYREDAQEVIYYYTKLEDNNNCCNSCCNTCTTECNSCTNSCSNYLVITRYEDENGNTIADEVVQAVAENQQYSTKKIVIDGYEFVKVSDDSDATEGTFIVPEEGEVRPIHVTYIYKAIQEEEPEPIEEPKNVVILVQYLDKESNNPVFDSVTLTGNEGDTYTVTRKAKDGYTLIDPDFEEIGEFSENQTLIYYYERIELPGVEEETTSYVVVKYVDENGQEIAEKEILTGKVGEFYFTTQKMVDGYTFVGVDNAEEGTYTDEIIRVTYSYKMIEEDTPEIIPAKENGILVVHYVDQDGVSIADDVITSEVEGTKYVTSQKVIDGYTFADVTDNYKGIYDNDIIEVVYTYSKNEEEVVEPVEEPATAYVVVKYVDGNGSEIAEKEILSGKVGEFYFTTQKQIDGYIFVEVDSEEEGTYVEGITRVTYTYEKIEETPEEPEPVKENGILVVHYVDQDGVSIADDVITSEVEGTKYVTSQKVIDGYTFADVTDNYKGTYDNDIIEVVYAYSKNEEEVVEPVEEPATAYVVVKYVEVETNKILAENIILTGKVGEAYFTTQKVIEGYEFVSSSENEEGVYTEEIIKVIYEYSKVEETPDEPEPVMEKGIVVVHYQDENGNTIANDEISTEEEGTKYVTIQKVVEGYEISELPENRNGVYTNDIIEVIYVYSKIEEEIIEPVEEPAAAYVVVKYVDGNGSEIAEKVILSGKVGEFYFTTQKQVDGYVFVEVDSEEEGTYVEGITRVVYTYEKIKEEEVTPDPIKENGILVVRYADQNGVSIADDVITSEVEGTKYVTSQKVIKGYTFVSVTDNYKGTYDNDIIEVVYTYSKNEEEVVEPVEEPATAYVVVKYVDGNGSEIAEKVILSGKVGEFYFTTQKQVDGYVFVEVDSEEEGTYVEGITRVTYTYEKVEEEISEPVVEPATAYVIVKYVEADTNKVLAENIVLTGKVGEAYFTTQKVIEGYEFVSSSENEEGVYTDEIIKVIYEYSKVEETPEEPEPVKENGILVVRYVNQDGVSIADDVITSEVEGTKYVTSQKAIEGYTFVSVTNNYKGTYDNDIIEVVYTYSKNEEEVVEPVEEPATAYVVVKYVDRNGSEIAEKEILSGKVGEFYFTTQKQIDGYIFVEVDSEEEGTYVEGITRVVYTYEKVEEEKPESIVEPKDITILVQYLEEETENPVFDSMTLKGSEGDTYTTIRKVKDGYTLVKPEFDELGIFSESTTFTYYYKKIVDEIPMEPEKALILVQYLDKNTGNPVFDSEILNGLIGDLYVITRKVKKDYTIENPSFSEIGEYTNRIQVFTYYYVKNEVDPVVEPKTITILVQYLDVESGNPVFDSVTLSGYEGDIYTTSRKAKEGYVLLTPNFEEIGEFTETQVLNYYYEAVIEENTVPEEAYVLVHYVDSNGNQILSDEVYTGNVGDTYVVPIKMIDGYTFVRVEKIDNAPILKTMMLRAPLRAASSPNIGTFTSEVTELNILYEENQTDEPSIPEEDKPAMLIVRYVDQDGTAVAEDSVTYGVEGDFYNASQKVISGYKYVSVDSDETYGVLPAGQTVITYTYEKLSEEKEEEEPTIPQSDNNQPVINIDININNENNSDNHSENNNDNTVENNSDNHSENNTENNINNDTNVENSNDNNVESNTDVDTHNDIQNDNHSEISNDTNVENNSDNHSENQVSNDTNVENSNDVNNDTNVDNHNDNTTEVNNDNHTDVNNENNNQDENNINIENNPVQSNENNSDSSINNNPVNTNNNESNPVNTNNNEANPTNNNENTVNYNPVNSSSNDNTNENNPTNQNDSTNTNENINSNSSCTENCDEEENITVESKKGMVIANYLDEDGKVLAASTITMDDVNKEYVTNIKDIPSYSFVKVVGEPIGKYVEGVYTVDYYYEKKEENPPVEEKKYGTVYTHYVDTNGNKIGQDKVEVLEVGSQYSTVKETFNGYNYLTVINNTNGIVKEGEIDVTYLYEPIQEELPVVEPIVKNGFVVVNYVDYEGSTLADKTIIEDEVGKVYFTDQKYFDGYTFMTSVGNRNGQIVEGITEVIYIYKKVSNCEENTCNQEPICPENSCPIEDKSGKVVARYVDEKGNILTDEVITEDKIGSNYVTLQKSFNGYHFVTVNGNRSGKYMDGVVEVTYIYALDEEETVCPSDDSCQEEEKTGMVVARYIDEKGNTLTDEVITEDKIGSNYVTLQKSFGGYHFVTVNGNRSGKYMDGVVEVTYIYALDEEETVCPSDDPCHEEEKTGKVVIHFVDEENHKLLEDKIIEGKLGEIYQTSKEIIENYTFKEVDGDENGSFQENDIEVTYIYTRNKGKVIAHYVDIYGSMLGYDITQEGYVNEAYETKYRRFKGYTFVQVVGAYAGQYQLGTVEVTYIYQKNEEGNTIPPEDDVEPSKPDDSSHEIITPYKSYSSSLVIPNTGIHNDNTLDLISLCLIIIGGLGIITLKRMDEEA